MSSFPDEKPPRVAFGMYKRFAIAGVLITLLTAGTVASAGLLEVKDLVSVIHDESAGHVIPGLKGALDDVPAGKPQTILVLGSDRRFVDIKQDNPARSDTMMLVRLDPSKEATAVMNIPRDLKVPIQVPGGGIDTTKINAAYSYGGPALAVKTVRNLLHIPINHVVNVNFGGFQRAVNRLGCVYVDVDRRYYHSNAGLPGQRSSTPRSTSPPATRSCAARSRWTTCASATPTTTSCARRASRTSCARPRTRSGSGGCSAIARSCCGSSGATPTPTCTRTRPSCACSSSPSSPRAIRSARCASVATSGRTSSPSSPNNLELTKAGVPARQGLQRARASSAAGAQAARARRASGARAHLARAAARRHRRQDGRREPRRAGRDAAELPALLPAGAAGPRGLLRPTAARALYDIYDTHHRRYRAYRIVAQRRASTASTTACRA